MTDFIITYSHKDDLDCARAHGGAAISMLRTGDAFNGGYVVKNEPPTESDYGQLTFMLPDRAVQMVNADKARAPRLADLRLDARFMACVQEVAMAFSEDLAGLADKAGFEVDRRDIYRRAKKMVSDLVNLLDTAGFTISRERGPSPVSSSFRSYALLRDMQEAQLRQAMLGVRDRASFEAEYQQNPMPCTCDAKQGEIHSDECIERRRTDRFIKGRNVGKTFATMTARRDLEAGQMVQLGRDVEPASDPTKCSGVGPCELHGVDHGHPVQPESRFFINDRVWTPFDGGTTGLVMRAWAQTSHVRLDWNGSEVQCRNMDMIHLPVDLLIPPSISWCRIEAILRDREARELTAARKTMDHEAEAIRGSCIGRRRMHQTH